MIAQSLFSFVDVERPSCEREDTGLSVPAAKSDPLTSRLAGEQIERDGTRRRQIEEVVEMVRRYPDRTALELQRITGLDRHKRLPDARKLGLLTSPAMRKCTISGKMAMTWRCS